MHISLHLSPLSHSEAGDIETIDELLEQAIAADAAGCATISLTEHHLAGFNTYCDPFMIGSVLAPQMTQAHLAILAVQVPLTHPVRLAEQCNLLDFLTRGKLLIGLGSGSVRELELEPFGVDKAERSKMTAQRTDAMVKAWGWSEGDGSLDVSTDYDQGVISGRLSPASFRKPHPLIARATATEATIIDCAERGWPAILAIVGEPSDKHRHWIETYRAALESAGHDEKTIAECDAWLGPADLISIAETEKEAKRRLDTFLELGGSDRLIVRDANEGGPEWRAEWRDRQVDRGAATFCGTPEMIVERFRASTEALGVNHFRTAIINTPGMHEQNMDAFRLFIEEIVPALDPEPMPEPSQTVLTNAAA